MMKSVAALVNSLVENGASCWSCWSQRARWPSRSTCRRASMEPTLLIGDALVASKYPYGYGMASMPMPITLGTTQRIFGALPERGDVVVFRWPGDISQTWVKRVVGLPGERVQMRHGQLFINGQAVPLRADGMGETENDDGSKMRAARYIETLPGGRSHPIFKVEADMPSTTRPK